MICYMRFQINDIAEIVKFYADTKVGTKGRVLKTWVDPDGCEWAKLYFGRNRSGQKLQKSFPANVLARTENLNLKPCPFCGAQPEWTADQEETPPCVLCANDECLVNPVAIAAEENFAQIIERWNLRESI